MQTLTKYSGVNDTGSYEKFGQIYSGVIDTTVNVNLEFERLWLPLKGI
jgi:hypothetical protein